MLAKLSNSNIMAFLVFVVLVWVAVDLSVVLSGLTPKLPAPLRILINPHAPASTTSTRLDAYAA